MGKKWKIAVVGCGWFANLQYLPFIEKEANAECVAVVDILEDRAKKAAEDFNVPNYYFSVYDLIKDCDFDIAIDAASIQAHQEINMVILGAGKHLITQKPAAPSVEKLTEQMVLAKKMGVKFACVPIHPMRYDLNIAKKMIKDGVIGDAYFIKCMMSHAGPEYFTYRDADPSWFYEPGAGALVDMGVHGLQIVTTVFGAAKRLSCMAKITTPRREIRGGAFDGKIIESDKLPDQYVITLDFGGNKMAVIDTGFSNKGSKCPALEIFGDKGTMSFVDYFMENKTPEVYMDDPIKGVRGWIRPMETVKPPKRLISQCCCLYDIIQAIENNTDPILSPEHARHVLEIMCKIPKAIETGKTIDLETTFENR